MILSALWTARMALERMIAATLSVEDDGEGVERLMRAAAVARAAIMQLEAAELALVGSCAISEKPPATSRVFR